MISVHNKEINDTNCNTEMVNLIFIFSSTNQNYFEIYNSFTFIPISREMDVFGKNVMYQMLIIITKCHGSKGDENDDY